MSQEHLSSNNPSHLWPNWLKYAVFIFIAVILWIFNAAYLSPLLLGFIIAALTFPLFRLIQTQLQRIPKLTWSFRIPAALLTLFGVSAVLIILIQFAVSGVAREIPGMARSVVSFIDNLPNNQQVLGFLSGFGITRDAVIQAIEAGRQSLSQYVGSSDSSAILSEDSIQRFLSVGQRAFGQIFDSLLYVIIFLLAWYNGLVFGPAWVDNIFKLLPLSTREIAFIRKNLSGGIRSVVYASLLSATIHASISFLLLLIFGASNIWTLTLIVFLIGLLPLSPAEIGYALVVAAIFGKNPTIVILLIPVLEAIILYMNYVLIPRVISSGSQGSNALLILTSLLSGVAIFGIMGFIIAPVVMIFVQTLYKILVDRLQKEPIYQSPKPNQV